MFMVAPSACDDAHDVFACHALAVPAGHPPTSRALGSRPEGALTADSARARAARRAARTAPRLFAVSTARPALALIPAPRRALVRARRRPPRRRAQTGVAAECRTPAPARAGAR